MRSLPGISVWLHQFEKFSWNFEILDSNSGYAPISQSLKPENGLRIYVWKATEVKHEFVKLVVISLLFARRDYVIPFLNLSINNVP